MGIHCPSEKRRQNKCNNGKIMKHQKRKSVNIKSKKKEDMTIQNEKEDEIIQNEKEDEIIQNEKEDVRNDVKDKKDRINKRKDITTNDITSKKKDGNTIQKTKPGNVTRNDIKSN